MEKHNRCAPAAKKAARTETEALVALILMEAFFGCDDALSPVDPSLALSLSRRILAAIAKPGKRAEIERIVSELDVVQPAAAQYL